MAFLPAVRGLFLAGERALHVSRELADAQDRCRALLDGGEREYQDLLAAGAAYSPLFAPQAPGDALGGVLGRLADHEDEAGEPAEDAQRSRQFRSSPVQNGAGAASGMLRDAPGIERRSNDETLTPFDPRPRDRSRPRVVPDLGRRPAGLVPAPTAESAALSPTASSDSVEPARTRVSEGGNEPHASPDAGSGRWRTWSAAAAARELSARVDRAHLADAWSRPIGEQPAAPAITTGAAPSLGKEKGLAGVIAARLAPAVDAIARRHAGRRSAAEASRAHSVNKMHAENEDASQATNLQHADTPLRRLAALGRHFEPPARAASEALEPTAPSRGSALALARLPRHMERAAELQSVAPAPSPARVVAGPGDDREFAERIAAVLFQEALRSGIDPVEYES